MGHGGFAQYLHRLKLKNAPHCACAPENAQDLLRVLKECPIFLKERAKTEAGTGVEITKWLQIIVKSSFERIKDQPVNTNEGEDGYHCNNQQIDPATGVKTNKKVSAMQFHRIMTKNEWLREQMILATKNNIVNGIYDIIQEITPEEEKIYMPIVSIDM
ncbi:hypothetical protein EVAR_32848_1 [Eumeta japonica]|uniref:Uncharacterized protein n=1 Tax=Eumeta variegata TaxID=151549 RepID=A0A4C1WAN3_EUMVA|nr:hypothetical protein EVAR_32848_1 [Eumeta japonica]